MSFLDTNEKKKSFVITSVLMSVLLLLFVFAGQTTVAQLTRRGPDYQKCLRTIFKREGTVHSVGGPGNQFVAPSNRVEIILEKTGGKANTSLNIDYGRRNNPLTERISFDFDEANGTKKITLVNVKGQRISMRLTNNSSAARTFKYKIEVIGKTENLVDHGKALGYSIISREGDQYRWDINTDVFEASVGGTRNKNSHIIMPSCSGKVELKLKGLSGRAAAEVRVYESGGRLLGEGLIGRNQEFSDVYTTNSEIRIDVKGKSSAATNLKYDVIAKAMK